MHELDAHWYDWKGGRLGSKATMAAIFMHQWEVLFINIIFLVLSFICSSAFTGRKDSIDECIIEGKR